MRGLTSTEKDLLERGCVVPTLDEIDAEDNGPMELSSEENALYEKLEKEGRATSVEYQGEKYCSEWWTTTELGKLALKVCSVDGHWQNETF